MSIALVPIRDRFANVNKHQSFKTRALLILAKDLTEMLGDEVTVIGASSYFKNGPRDFEEFDKIIVSEPPFFASGAGFTCPPEPQMWAQLRSLLETQKPHWSWGFEKNPRTEKFKNDLVKRTQKITEKTNIYGHDITIERVRELTETNSLSAELQAFKEQRKHHIIGDSHAYSMWRPGTSAMSHQGSTLFRTLDNGLESVIEGKPEVVEFVLGNIDLRHHLGRREDPINSAKELALEFSAQAKKLSLDLSVYEWLPVVEIEENLKTAYYYKKEKSHGSAELRSQCRDAFVSTILEQGIEVRRTPKALMDEDGFAVEDAIEKRGIHLRNQCCEFDARGEHTRNEAFAWQS